MAKLLVKVDNILKPSSISFEDYTMQFSVSGLHPKPTNLDDDAAYQFMMSWITQSKDPNTAITVEPIVKEKVK
jgi:hypothetical protein